MGFPVGLLASFVAIVDVLALAAAMETVAFGAGGVAFGAWLGMQCHDVEVVLGSVVLEVENRCQRCSGVGW